MVLTLYRQQGSAKLGTREEMYAWGSEESESIEIMAEVEVTLEACIT